MENNPSPQGNFVPSEFQVFPAGTVHIHGGGSFTVNDSVMNQIIERFKSRGLDLVIDYERQTEGKAGQYDYSSPDGTAPAAGWIKRLVNKGANGLWAVVEWTEKAKKFLSNKEYRYFSPVFTLSKKDGLVELLRVALTNAPRLNDIKPIIANYHIIDNDGPDDNQRAINKLLGVSDEVWAKHNPDRSELGSRAGMEGIQKEVNRLVGLDDETWHKYNPGIGD